MKTPLHRISLLILLGVVPFAVFYLIDQNFDHFIGTALIAILASLYVLDIPQSIIRWIRTGHFDTNHADSDQWTSDEVRPWTRLLARHLDFFIFSTAMYFAVDAFIFSSYSTNAISIWLFTKVYGDITGRLAFLYTLICGSFLFNALCTSFFGNTIFKQLAGVKVITAAKDKLSLSQAISREFGVFFNGVWLGLSWIIPFLYIFSFTRNYHFLKRHGKAQWDEEGNFCVVHRRKGFLQTLGLVTSLIVLTTCVYAFGASSRQYLISSTNDVSTKDDKLGSEGETGFRSLTPKEKQLLRKTRPDIDQESW